MMVAYSTNNWTPTNNDILKAIESILKKPELFHNREQFGLLEHTFDINDYKNRNS